MYTVAEETKHMAYRIDRLTKTEYATLGWLSDHGYDAGILAKAGVDEEFSDGGALLGTISEPDAWAIQEMIEEDPDAFLSCNGSRSLSEKLHKFLDKIV